MVPQPKIIVVSAPVPLTYRRTPHFIPSGLIRPVTFRKTGLDLVNQAATVTTLPVIVDGKTVVSVLAGHRAEPGILVKKKAASGFQKRPVGDIHFAGKPLEPGAFPGDILMTFHLL